MNIQQLEYIIAVDNYRHFAKAAEASFVTQPTLSMMIQKMEDELNIKIFDRSSHPIRPTQIGEKIIEQARITVKHFNQIFETVQEERQELRGTFNLGIIPTIAPYLVPNLLKLYEEREIKHFQLNLREATTDQILEGIANGTLDGGILATPLKRDRLQEHPIYYEKFYAYISSEEALHAQQKITLEEFETLKQIWILDDVHCFRTQVFELCQFAKKKQAKSSANYEAGSIDTLINIVDHNQGGTIIPELAAMQLSEDQQDNLRDFKDITAVREISLVVGSEFVRFAMMNEIISMVRRSIPTSMQNDELKQFAVDLPLKKAK